MVRMMFWQKPVLKSPVVNSDGTVTFNYQGDGQESCKSKG